MVAVDRRSMRCGADLLPRVGPTASGPANRYCAMVAVCLRRWAIRLVGRHWISSRGIGRGAALGPHGAAHPAVTARGTSDPARRTGAAAVAWLAAPLQGARWSSPVAPIDLCARVGTGARAASDLLERGPRRFHRLAYTATLPIGPALGRLACARTRELFRERAPVLVASRSALAEHWQL